MILFSQNCCDLPLIIVESSKSLTPVPVYVCASLAVCFLAGLFSVGVIDYPMSVVLPFSLFVFSSLLERGVLIPNNVSDQG